MRWLWFLPIFFLPFTLFAQNYFELAEKKFEAAEFEQAKILFQKHCQDRPEDLKSKEYLGDIEAHLKNWDGAISIYKDLLKSLPESAGLHYKHGGAMGMKASENRWFALTNYKEIRNEFEETLRLDPLHIDAHWALVEYYLQLPFILGGGEEKAKYIANQLMKISKVDGYLALGRIAEFYNKHLETEKAFIRANQIGRSVHTFRTLGKFYEKRNQKEKADAVYEKAKLKFGNEFSDDLKKLSEN